MDTNNQNVSVEWVLIALLSVFALSSVVSILLSFSVIMINTSMNAYDLISEGFFIGPIKGSAYWLMGVGALWFMAHRLGFYHWWALVIISAAVSIGMSVVFNGAHLSLFWFAVNTLISSFMGWVLWRLAYGHLAPSAGANAGEYQTTIGRGIAALLSGGLTGIVATMAIAMIVFGGMGPRNFQEIGGIVLGFWLGGGFILGGVLLVALDFFGLRQWYGMTIAGGLIMLALGLVLFENVLGTGITLIMALLGSAVGWVIWRVAYRRAPLER